MVHERRLFSTACSFPIQQMKFHLQHYFQTVSMQDFLKTIRKVNFTFEENANEYYYFISTQSPYLYLTSYHAPTNTTTILKQQTSETKEFIDAKHSVLLLLYQNLHHSIVALLLKKSDLQKDKNPNYVHANQFALPGGSKNKDETLEDCALRETMEEVNFMSGPQYQHYEILNSSMSSFATHAGSGGSLVKPFIGTMNYEHQYYEFQLQKNEIAEAFEIPLLDLISALNENGRTLARVLNNNNSIYYHGITFTLNNIPSIDNDTSTIEVWGFTARLLSYFFAVLYKNTQNSNFSKPI